MRSVDADAKREAGRQVREARESLGLSKREAARRARSWLQERDSAAKFSEALWRNIERGERNAAPGVVVPNNTSAGKLQAVAHVVTVPAADLLMAYGYEPATERPGDLPSGSGTPGDSTVDHIRKTPGLPDYVIDHLVGTVEFWRNQEDEARLA